MKVRYMEETGAVKAMFSPFLLDFESYFFVCKINFNFFLGNCKVNHKSFTLNKYGFESWINKEETKK